MSRITESLAALKAERRTLAGRLKRMDRLIAGYDAITGPVAPRKPRTKAKRRLASKPRVVAKSRPIAPKREVGASFATSAI